MVESYNTVNKMANVLILGGKGKLGICFSELFPEETLCIGKAECDITDTTVIEKLIKNFTGNYILNAAAITDMAYCEKDSSTCFTTNTLPVYALTKLCAIYRKKFIFISSNYAVDPPNIYGWSKFFAEKAIFPPHLVIRTNFYSQKSYIIQKLLRKEKFQAYENVYFNPVSIYRCVREIWKHKNAEGILNIFSDKAISYYTFAQMFAEISGRDKTLIQKSEYTDKHLVMPLSLHSFIQPDITVTLENDLRDFTASLQL